MDAVHSQRIIMNLNTLVKETNYIDLIESFERVPNRVIPESLLSKWKARRDWGWTNNQLNREFYSEIQRRGPEAYELLIKCLQFNQIDLACILDPTISNEKDEKQPEREYYSDAGEHFVHLDCNWIGNNCISKDREELQNFFNDQGYTDFKENDLECAGSLLYINFCQFPNGLDREVDCINKYFNDPKLKGKPKIIFSLRYISSSQNQSQTEQDSGRRDTMKFCQDILQVQIVLDTSKQRTSGVSEEVAHFIRVFSANEFLNIDDKLLQLGKELQKHNCKSLVVKSSDFKNLYLWKKSGSQSGSPLK